MHIKPIGIIRTDFRSKGETPIQGIFDQSSTATVEVFPEFQEGLKDIEAFSHLILLYGFDRAGEVELVRLPFLDDVPHGIFATRHPCRPNAIGLTVVRLLRRVENRLDIAGIDVLDETPLLDIKPYVVRFDCFPEASEGWFATTKARPKPPGRE